MNGKPRFTIRFLLVATMLAAISVAAYRLWNIELEIAELPRPNSGTFTIADAKKLRPEFLAQAVGVRQDHELIKNWRNPYFGFHVHVARDGAITVADQFGSKKTGRKAFNDARELMDSMLMGNPGGVLITSETAGWAQPKKMALVDSLFEPSVQVFFVRQKQSGQ